MCTTVGAMASTDMPVLLTDSDVLARVRELVGPAITDRQLWIMFVDGDGRQAPVVMPISDLPRFPEPGGITNLSSVLGSLRDDLATDLGPGSVILTCERLGTDRTLPQDRDWAQALTDACISAEIELRGLFLSTRSGVRRLL